MKEREQKLSAVSCQRSVLAAVAAFNRREPDDRLWALSLSNGQARSHKGAQKTAAFTLLELLVAVTITLALAGLMLAVVTGTLNLWSRTQDNFSTAAEAKLALDLVERDLQAAVFREDGGNWLAVDVGNTPASLASHGWLLTASSKPASGESQRVLPDVLPRLSNARFGLSGAWLRFLTTNGESGGSLPVTVSYQIARRPLSGSITAGNPSERRYSLFRAAVSSANTVTGGNDMTAAVYGSSSSTPTATRSAATVSNPNSTDVLVTNAVDFGVWLYVRGATGELQRIFPADNSDFSHRAQDAGSAPDVARFPAVVDVMVRILSDRGATLLAEMESGTGHVTRPGNFASDADWWWSVVEANSRVYVRRVAVQGRVR